MSAAQSASEVSCSDIEQFLFHEAALLDSWKLDEWLTLLTEDATYLVPPNDVPGGDRRNTLYTIADDIDRIRGRVKRLASPNAHAEYPHSRTRRLITNVRIVGSEGDMLDVEANFVIYRFRRGVPDAAYVGRYAHRLRVDEDGLRIAERKAILDPEELGQLGSISFVM